MVYSVFFALQVIDNGSGMCKAGCEFIIFLLLLFCVNKISIKSLVGLQSLFYLQFSTEPDTSERR